MASDLDLQCFQNGIKTGSAGQGLINLYFAGYNLAKHIMCCVTHCGQVDSRHSANQCS